MTWSLFMVCISAVCGPAFFSKQSLVTESGQGAPGISSGEVTAPTWPCDGAAWPHDCKTMSGTWQLWPQVHNSVSGWGDWGKNPQELRNLLKRRKKPLGPLAAHWTRKKPLHVRVQVTSHKRGCSVRWKIFSFSDVRYQRWKLPEDVAVYDLRMEFPHSLWVSLVIQSDASPSGLHECWWFCNSL